MNRLPYSPDFPDLISAPAASYAHTLELSGVDHDTAVVRLIVMDVLVKLAVEEAGLKLGFRAPENIFVEDVVDCLDIQAETMQHPEKRAVVHKATLILRGDMEPSPIWDMSDQAA